MLLLMVIAVLVLAFPSGITALIDVVLAGYFNRSAGWVAGGTGFSVGIMLLISLLELIRESWAVAGAMIFVSIHELIPMARKYGHPSLFVAVCILVYVGLGAIISQLRASLPLWSVFSMKSSK